MMRLFMPLMFVGIAIAIFVVYTNPIYKHIQELSVQNASYDSTLSKAQELRGLRDSLLSKRNSFSDTDMMKLQEVLPDDVNNIRLIIDVNSIAARHGLTLGNVDLGGTITNATNVPAQQQTSTADTGPVGSAHVGFSVTTNNYQSFLAFVQDLEHSLRLIDIKNLSFASAPNGDISYNMQVNTYWLH